MKKKVLTVILSAALVSTFFVPVSGAEFTCPEPATESFSDSTDEVTDSKILQPEEKSSELSENPDVSSNEQSAALDDEDEVIGPDKLELVKGPDKSPYLLGSITGINTIDLTGLILKLSDDTKTCEATMDECLSDWMADSIGNLYTGSLLDSNFKQITDNDYDVYLGPGEYYALIDYSEGVDVKVPISIQVPDETPVLTKTGPDRYEATSKIWDRSAYGFFTPEITGSYAILSGEDHPAFLFDESGKNVSEQNGVFDLQAGHKYTILNTEFFSETEAHISAELAYNIASIEPVGDFSQKTTYYTPVDFNRGGFTAKEKVGIGERWNGKIKINYVNGESEIISSRNGRNKYGMSVERYVIYNGKSEYPDAGTYDVHIGIQGSDKETVIKNVSVKKSSAMPTINNSGTKSLSVGRREVCARIKTGKSTRYVVSGDFQQYNSQQAGISIYTERNGILDWNGYFGYVQNGKACSLKPNTVYYLVFNLYDTWAEKDSVSFTLKPQSASISKCVARMKDSTYTYTGKAITPSVDVSVDSASGTYLFKDIDYTLTYKNNINVGTATVIIKGKGTYSGSLKLNFKIQLRKPVLKSVKKSGSTDVKLTWKKTTGTTGYEIYRTSGNSWKKIASVNSTSYTDKKLEKGALYKYKIRAYKNVNGKKQYSEYSPQKSVKR